MVLWVHVGLQESMEIEGIGGNIEEALHKQQLSTSIMNYIIEK